MNNFQPIEMKKKVSLILTVKNEGNSIDPLLRSLENQTRTPDEIVIADGGSTDDTQEKIREFKDITDIPLNLIIKDGINIARGRNLAIESTKYQIIAVTDGGCLPRNDWLENIIKPFNDKKADVVAGWYESIGKTDIERISSYLFLKKLGTVLKDPDSFFPSSRSVAFKKKCWETVGGYPEYLYTAEDTLFDIKLKSEGFKFVFAPKAVVLWEARSDLISVYKQQYLYRKGDGHAKIFSRKYWGSRYFIYSTGLLLVLLSFKNINYMILLLFGILLYLSIHIYMVYSKLKLKNSIVLVPVILFGSDLVGLIGYIVGRIERASGLMKGEQ